jgi:hypothetical protein
MAVIKIKPFSECKYRLPLSAAHMHVAGANVPQV